ncbi:MAG: hypothetical protein INH06_16890, partial [Cupriavidus sp.]|nr:hypothetical protein [Cupriavidus sp.]
MDARLARGSFYNGDGTLYIGVAMTLSAPAGRLRRHAAGPVAAKLAQSSHCSCAASFQAPAMGADAPTFRFIPEELQISGSLSLNANTLFVAAEA